MALRLTQRGAGPRALFVAGMLPPQHRRASTAHTLPDEELLRSARDLGGIPEVIGEDPVILKSFLRLISADVTALESSRYTSGSRLSCPVVVFDGRDDPLVVADVAAGAFLAAENTSLLQQMTSLAASSMPWNARVW